MCLPLDVHEARKSFHTSTVYHLHSWLLSLYSVDVKGLHENEIQPKLKAARVEWFLPVLNRASPVLIVLLNFDMNISLKIFLLFIHSLLMAD